MAPSQRSRSWRTAACARARVCLHSPFPHGSCRPHGPETRHRPGTHTRTDRGQTPARPRAQFARPCYIKAHELRRRSQHGARPRSSSAAARARLVIVSNPWPCACARGSPPRARPSSPPRARALRGGAHISHSSRSSEAQGELRKASALSGNGGRPSGISIHLRHN